MTDHRASQIPEDAVLVRCPDAPVFMQYMRMKAAQHEDPEMRRGMLRPGPPFDPM